ncbi:hypothetical protein AWZ03_000487 [Drosophila navojoa]|uniref:Uncharacterized protein n=1 Tax=Drosophila navojoa TaxID=7232 RepID=A0A484BW91_DRONA|nr:hypothetical protein AWZ03_000487 [Drosophila navojoa]
MRPRVESLGALTSTSTYRNLTWARAGARAETGAGAQALALWRMTPDDSGIKIKPHDIRRQEATRACANAKPRAAAGQEAG